MAQLVTVVALFRLMQIRAIRSTVVTILQILAVDGHLIPDEVKHTLTVIEPFNFSTQGFSLSGMKAIHIKNNTSLTEE